ncbi:MAG: DsbA family protein [Thermoleophilaceae bacterium]
MAGSSTVEPDRQPVLYYDVGSPWCWLAAERAHEVLGTVPVWQPVLAPASDSARTEVHRAAVERRAAEQAIPQVRWPDPFPFDSELAMLVATFAKQTGRAVAFSLAAMRQAFAAGRDLSVLDNVLIAAAACELHPRAVTKALETRSVAAALREATETARADLGVTELPAIAVGGVVVAAGPDAPEHAVALRSGF